MFGFEDSDSDVQFVSQRMRMVDQQLVRRGIRDGRVLSAMRAVPRHEFIPEGYRQDAYKDGPQPIGEGQTISQPYIVASMTEHLELTEDSKVLEIGTGCGYQTAVLAEITKQVYSIEVVPGLLDKARRILSALGYNWIETRLGDGASGWPEAAPFDGIIVTAAAPQIPPALIEQLAVDGRMVIPVESGYFGSQELVKVTKSADGKINRKVLYEVRFVPMQGDVGG